MYDYDRSRVSSLRQASLNETTQMLLRDASSGPGPGPKAVASAKPAQPGKLTATQDKVLQQFDGATFGFVSKALIYDKLAPRNSIELRALASLLKGGLLEATERPGGVPGAPAHQVGGQGPRHYVLRRTELAKTAASADRKFDHYISLAADDIEKLRRPDVYRVLEQAKSAKELAALSAYIVEKRPDLNATVGDDVKDLSDEKGW